MKKSKPEIGDEVVLNCPDNKRLHGKEGTVIWVHEWGCLVRTPAAGSGEFRASWDEIIIKSNLDILPTDVTMTVHEAAKFAGYTGDVCTNPACGGSRMRRNGVCLLCEDCQQSSGCS